MTTLPQANRFLRQRYIQEFNRKFTVQATEPGTAFVPLQRLDLDRVFALQYDPVVNRDNTVQWLNRCLQLEKVPWRPTFSGSRVTVYEHLNGTVSVGYGPETLGRYTLEGRLLRTTGKRTQTKPRAA